MSRSIDTPIETAVVIFAGILSLTNKLRYIRLNGKLTISVFRIVREEKQPAIIHPDAFIALSRRERRVLDDVVAPVVYWFFTSCLHGDIFR